MRFRGRSRKISSKPHPTLSLLAGRISFDCVIDRARPEVRIDHSEVILALILFVVVSIFEEPIGDHTDERPVILCPLVGLDSVSRRLLIRYLTIFRSVYHVRYGTRIRDRVPGHLTDPDRLGLIAIRNHHVAQPEQMRIVYGCWAHPLIGWSAEQAITLRSQNIETLSGMSIVHALQKHEIVQVGTAQFHGLSQR